MRSIEWAAGLFEGEGCIYTGNQSKFPHNKYHQLTIAMSDKDAVASFAKTVGYGEVRSAKQRRDDWKPMYWWKVSKTSEVQRILAALLPYLCNRRAYKALNVLDDIELAL